MNISPPASAPSSISSSDKILQSQQSRSAFQAEQQRLREQDRQIVVPQVQRPEVPVMKSSCQIELFGSIYRRVCR
jgi:TFIIF-interacting CTD phosphatase-like protein